MPKLAKNMNEADKIIKYREDLIENIKKALEICLQRTNDIELDDKEMSFIIYCNNRDRLIKSGKSDYAMKLCLRSDEIVEL